MDSLLQFDRETDAVDDRWSYPELSSPQRDPQDLSISEILDHGSISFGRYASESLAWEKRSVFSHNKCQEELEKFKAPGLVAQKKAYFEEYYKKLRAMKGLQAEQQETTQPGSCYDGQRNISQAENCVDATVSEEEKKPDDVCEIHIREEEIISCIELPGRRIVNKSEGAAKQQQIYSNNNDNKVCVMEETTNSLASIDPGRSVEVISPLIAPSTRSSEAAQQISLVSDTDKQDANKPKKQIPVLQAKPQFVSAGNKTKSECRISKDAVKPSAKVKPLLQKEINGKTDKNLVSRKGTIPKAASNIRSKSNHVYSHRGLTEVSSSSIVLHSSFAKDKPMLRSSGIRGGQMKVTSTLKSMAEKLPSRLPDHVHFLQRTSKETTATFSIRKLALDNTRSYDGVAGKFLNLNSHHIRPRGGESENQKPKIMSTNLATRNTPSKSIGVEFGHRNYVKRGTQKEGKEDVNSGPGTSTKSAASSMLSRIQKAPNPNLLNKSMDLTRNRMDSRHKMPIWR